jgi:hypothetical protein
MPKSALRFVSMQANLSGAIFSELRIFLMDRRKKGFRAEAGKPFLVLLYSW